MSLVVRVVEEKTILCEATIAAEVKLPWLVVESCHCRAVKLVEKLSCWLLGW